MKSELGQRSNDNEIELLGLKNEFRLVRKADSLMITGALADQRSFIIKVDEVEESFFDAGDYDYFSTLASMVYEFPSMFNARIEYLDKSTSEHIGYCREAFYLDEDESYAFNDKHKLGDLKKDIVQLIASYSKGFTVQYIDTFLEKMSLKKYKTNWNLEDLNEYYLVLSFASICVLRKDNIPFQNLECFIPTDEDRLLDFITNDSNKTDFQLASHHPDPYIFLNLLHQNEASVSDVSRFLLNFYGGLKTVSWHDSHLERHNEFFGYWSFALVALVHKLNIDDSSFIDHMFYPRDLLEKPFLATWREDEIAKIAREEKKRLLQTTESIENLFGTSAELIIKEILDENVSLKIREKLDLIFSSSFAQVVSSFGDKNTDLEKYKEVDNMRSLLNNFSEQLIATEINDSQTETKSISREQLKEEFVARYKKKDSNLSEANIAELESYFESPDVKQLIDSMEINFFEVGTQLKKLQEEYSEDDKVYLDKVEELFNKVGLLESQSEKIQDEIGKNVQSYLKKKIGNINFNFSLDDYMDK